MGVRSTTISISATLLLCGALTSCTDTAPTEQEIDAEHLELARAADALSASVLRPGVERAFARKGHPIDGTLTCSSPAVPSEPEASGSPSSSPSPETTRDGQDTVTAHGAQDESEEGAEEGEEPVSGDLAVICEGLDRDGATLRFEGRLSSEALAERTPGDDSLPGSFAGTVDGDEVFTMDCFQCAPQVPEPEEAESDGTETDELAGEAESAAPEDE